ncbi:MAG: hypothetical protein U9O98_05685, partial [Asgard group archaeon]|nr:hypothetical protein [Asgard group archaeon]
EFYTGAIIIFIAFLLTPLAVRNFIRFLQGSKAYKIVKKLKEKKKTSRLLELANLRELNAPKIAKLQMMFSINALVDMGEEQILSILIEQYKTALEHDFQAERFEEPLQIMAEKLGYNNFHQLLEEKAVRYEKDKE